MSHSLPRSTTAQNTETLKEVMKAQGFRAQVSVTAEPHTFAGFPVKNLVSFVNPFDEDNNSLTVWSVNTHGLTRLCYSSTDDLNDHVDISTDCEGAVIVKDDFKHAATELAQKIKGTTTQVSPTFHNAYNGLY